MKRGTPRHPKTKALERNLSIPNPYAVGILENLWHFTGEFTPQGDVGHHTNRAIADAVGWPDDPTVLINALVAERWLDVVPEHRLVIHDWPDHADDAVRKKLYRAHMEFLPFYGTRARSISKLVVAEEDVAGRRPDAGATPSGRRADGVRPTRAEGQGQGQGLAQASGEASIDQVVTAVVVTEKDPHAVRKAFALFWNRWCTLTRRKQRESFACQAWISVVTFETQATAMACLERYGVSDEVQRGIVTNPDKWLFDQARDHFAGEWQIARNAGPAAVPKSKSQRTTEIFLANMSDKAKVQKA